MPITQVELKEMRVTDRLASRLIAVFGNNVPEPPVEMMGLVYPGEYAHINEFYAMKYLAATDINPSVARVLKLIGGKTSRVSDSIRVLREELGTEAFTPASTSDSSNSTEALKKILIKEERAIFQIELEEQAEIFEKHAIDAETQYDKRVVQLQADVNKEIGRNLTLQEQLDYEKAKTEKLTIELNEAKLNKRDLTQAINLAEERLATINDLRESASKNMEAYKFERSTAAKMLDELQSERDAYESRAIKANKKVSETEVHLKGYIEKQNELVLHSAELTNLLKQKDLQLKNADEQTSFIETISKAILPINTLEPMIDKLAKVKHEKAIDMNKITNSLNDVSTKILNLTSSIDEVRNKDNK